MKKDMGKWCEYHKIPWHNTEECRSKKSLVAELKASESEVDSDSESNPEGGKQIIDVEPSATVATTKVLAKRTRRTRGRGMPLSLTDVGKGGSASFHCR
jgi:hypothetical protein